jgi:hypothetical protein
MIKSKYAKHLHKDRVHMLFKDFEVFTARFSKDAIDIDWHGVNFQFKVDAAYKVTVASETC